MAIARDVGPRRVADAIGAPLGLPHATGAAEVARALGTDAARGLEPAEAARRLAIEGPNRLPERPARTRLAILLDQFRNVLVALLAAAAGLALALGETGDAAAIAAILLLNAVVGYVQEARAADALASLRRMVAPRARVRRGGTEQAVPAEGLVRGDLVVLEAGDRVPADVRLLSASRLGTVEAALTGESEPVRKDPGAVVPERAPIGDRAGMAWLGTTVSAGTGEGVVVATGSRTEFGRIADLVRSEPEAETPLQARLRVFGRRLVAGCGAVVALVFALGLLRGVAPIEMLLASVSLAVAAVPEGLPAIVTVALALGVGRMARRGALVRRLASVETLGATTVIASDKTGTLTLGRMELHAVALPDAEVAVSGGDGEARRFRAGGRDLAPRPGEPLHAILRASVACSTARIVERDGRSEVAGDPTEGALLVAARAAGVEAGAIEREEPALEWRPFDPGRKRASVLRRGAGGPRAYAKGAPEAILPLCGLAPGEAEGWAARADGLGRRALRVLAVASREGPGDPERDLRLLGLVGLMDPPRPGAREAVASCREAGVRTVMVTGDHPRTALAIAREIGIVGEEAAVLPGPDLDALSDEALREESGRISVYARVSPEGKLRLVRALRARGESVAVTGDGVNDAPALRAADIGVAMGLSGTDVAKDAAALVLTDDEFSTIVAAVREGRTIFDNIRKTLLYLIAGNVAEIAVMAGAVLLGWPVPLLPIQLLWINLVTDGLPALALVTDPPDPDALRRPPRRPGTPIADRAFLGWTLLAAALAAACSLGAFAFGLHVRGSLEEARTLAFSTLVFEEVIRALVFRSDTKTFPEVGALSNLRLLAVVAATVTIQVASHHAAPLQAFLRTGPLGWGDCAASLALAAVPATVLESSKLVRRALARRGRSAAG